MNKLVTSLTCQMFPTFTVITYQGETPSEVSFIWKGSVILTRSINVPNFIQEDFVVAKISEGSFFGEFSILTDTGSMFQYVAEETSK